MELYPVYVTFCFRTEDGSCCIAAENEIPQLTANQLEIARKIVLVLIPVEEVTQAISKQTATLSIVIPLIRVLLRS